MGLMRMAKMYRLSGAELKTLPQSKGPAVVVTGSFGEDGAIAELWGQPGVWTMPPDGTHAVLVPVGDGTFRVFAATHHYKTPRPTLAKGETTVGATSSDGLLLKAHTIYKSDGVQELNGNSKRLITNDLVGILATFITALNASLATAGGTPVSIDISAAVTTTVKTGG